MSSRVVKRANTSEVTIAQLCVWASQLNAVVVSVPAIDEDGIMGHAHTPNCCTFTLPAYSCLSTEEKDALYAHIKSGGSVILLSRESANDPSVLAHELGHVAAFLADCDRDFRKPAPKLVRRARRCGLDEQSRESNDELMAECVAWRMLDWPLSPLLFDFCEPTFSEFARRTGWQSRWSHVTRNTGDADLNRVL
jgi:hypothetical protein